MKLISAISYNKEFRNPLIPQMVDKLEVKKHVSKYLKVANVLKEITDPCIIKATNDSGGYKIIKDGKEIEKAPGRLTKTVPKHTQHLSLIHISEPTRPY